MAGENQRLLKMVTGDEGDDDDYDDEGSYENQDGAHASIEYDTIQGALTLKKTGSPKDSDEKDWNKWILYNLYLIFFYKHVIIQLNW